MQRFLSSCFFAVTLLYPIDATLLSSRALAAQSNMVVTELSAQRTQARRGETRRGRPNAQQQSRRRTGANRSSRRPPVVHHSPPRRGNWSRPGRYTWRPGGAIAAGAALGFLAAAAAPWAGAPPAPGLCWYYTDWSRTSGLLADRAEALLAK